MRTFPKLSGLALSAALSALALGTVPSAQADSTAGALAMGVAQGASEDSGLSTVSVQKVENLYRFQARPWARIPQGVALTVRVPRGTTEADLHNMVTDCTRGTSAERWPVCVKGAEVSVKRVGGSYLVSITSQDRATAQLIQERAAHQR